MQLPDEIQKDAIKCFKIIQKVMNAKEAIQNSYADIQALLDKGIRIGRLRDEILVQICKVIRIIYISFVYINYWSFTNI